MSTENGTTDMLILSLNILLTAVTSWRMFASIGQTFGDSLGSDCCVSIGNSVFRSASRVKRAGLIRSLITLHLVLQNGDWPNVASGGLNSRKRKDCDSTAFRIRRNPDIRRLSTPVTKRKTIAWFRFCFCRHRVNKARVRKSTKHSSRRLEADTSENVGTLRRWRFVNPSVLAMRMFGKSISDQRGAESQQTGPKSSHRRSAPVRIDKVIALKHTFMVDRSANPV